MATHKNPTDKIFNAGYEITQRIDLGDRQFVVGHSATAPSPYVSWEYFAERDSFYQGHYFQEEADATLDMFRRASEDLSFEGKSLGTALLTDEDRTNLFLEFRNQNARQDIENALAEELSYQDESYDLEALLEDPDFMSRAMFHYDRLDHGYENEALRDEIAGILGDFPQHMLPNNIAQDGKIQISPELNALITDLLTMPTAKIPEKYGPLGDNASFELYYSGGRTPIIDLIPDTDLLDPNKLSDTHPHYASLKVVDASGETIHTEVIWGKDLTNPQSPKEHIIEFKDAKITLTLQEDESLRRVGNTFEYVSNSTDERYASHDGDFCKIQRALTAQECDILCTGFMWVAEFSNGDVLHVFDDELYDPTPQKILKTPLSQQIQKAEGKATVSNSEQKKPEQGR